MPQQNQDSSAFKSKLQSEMGGAILDHLNVFQNIRGVKEGFIAGQAVASAIYDLFGYGAGAVYNDIDAFVPYRGDGSDIGLSPNYMPKNTGYTVLKVERDGMLNTVHYIGDLTANGDPSPSVIEHFDLNCVQVGVDVKNGCLLWTPEFSRFCDTREIEIVNHSRPYHSLIRYFNKRDQLPLSVGNDDATLEASAATILYQRKYGVSSPRFSDEYEQKYLKVKKHLDLWFDLLPEIEEDGKKLYSLTPHKRLSMSLQWRYISPGWNAADKASEFFKIAKQCDRYLIAPPSEPQFSF